MANNDPLNSESRGEPTSTTTESGAEEKASPAARNPCGICRAGGSPVCKGHGGGGGGLSESATETGSVSPGVSPAISSPATALAPPVSIAQFLTQNQGWESQDDSDALFKFENPEALFTLELDIEQGTLIFSGNDDLSAEEQETLNEFLSAMENELAAFKKEPIEQGKDPELIDQIKFVRDGNVLTLVLPTPMPAIYDALVKRLIDKNFIPGQPKNVIAKTVAQDFIKKLQDATGKEPLPQKFWADYREKNKPTFQDVLEKYADYCKSLPSPQQKKEMDKLFWEQIKAIGGTPIIEDSLSYKGECDVYFLFPKDKLDKSEEVPRTKKDLYLQGDFHGYDSTDGRQRLLKIKNTGIMWHKDTMPKDSLVVYSYIQVEPSQRGIEPEPELPPFFEDGDEFTPRTTNTAIFPKIPQSGCRDEYSTHASPYFFDSPVKIARINSDPKRAHIPGKPVDWLTLLSTDNTRHFGYHTTLYSDIAGDLHRSNARVTEHYHDDLFYSNGYNLSLKTVDSFDELDTTTLGENPYLIKVKGEKEDEYKMWGYKENGWQLTDLEPKNVDSLNIPPEKWEPNQTVFVSITDASFNTLKKGHTPYLPYADFTRAIQVFKPASSEIDNIIVVNDGIPSLITGCMDHFEKMVAEKKLSPNTAFVFITPLPGLEKSMSPEVAARYNADPSKDLGGMGFRLIDYRHGIDQYIDFIDEKLFPELEKEEIGFPSDPRHRVMRGVSLSGTASIYIGSERPDLFDAVIAQSPSSANRAILSDIPRAKLTGKNIYLSGGKFEHPDYAAANAFIEYAKELSRKLGIPLHTGAHGHQNIAWNEELEGALPALALQKIIDSAHVPAVSYASVLPNEDKSKFTPTSLAVGKKDAESAESENFVDENTQFPASSLSKIAFTYLVLQLVNDPKVDFNLDTPLYDILGKEKFVYERFREKAVSPDEIGNYPEKAKQLTARHVLSHTTGLPNVEPNSTTLPTFDNESDLGEGYSYSGEAILYLQKAIEAKTGQDLETLAKEYVFDPLHMDHSTFLRQPEDDNNIVKVHSELGVPTTINENSPELNVANAAGSLVTTADDYSKLMVAWLENMDDPIIQQAFVPKSEKDSRTPDKRTCGLGWHIHKNKKNEVIAYQYGENFNTRSFVAINVNDKKGAVFFTNSKNGSSIASQILNSPDLPPIGDLQDVYKDLDYSQSNEPGWQDTMAGKIMCAKGNFKEAKRYFEKAISSAPKDVSKQNRLEWFNQVHPSATETQAFTLPETFAGEYTNTYGDEVKMYLEEDGSLIHEQYGHKTKLVQVSETNFLPENDQSFKIRIDGNKMSKFSIEGNEYKLLRTLPVSKLTEDAEHVPIEPTPELLAARKVNQQYRGALEDLKANEAASTAAIAGNEDKTPSPFQITPKPSGDE